MQKIKKRNPGQEFPLHTLIIHENWYLLLSSFTSLISLSETKCNRANMREEKKNNVFWCCCVELAAFSPSSILPFNPCKAKEPGLLALHVRSSLPQMLSQMAENVPCNMLPSGRPQFAVMNLD